MILIQSLALLFSILILVKSTDFLVSVLDGLAAKTHLKKLSLTFILIALSTSFPELAVGLTAAAQGRPFLSLGNVLGSNIANLGLITAGSALLVGHLKTTEIKSLNRSLVFGFGVSLLPFLLLWDKKLSQIDGFILISLFLWYSLTSLSGRDFKEYGLFGVVSGFAKNFISKKTLPLTAQFFLGAAILFWAAQNSVRFSVNLASELQIPLFFVGLFLLAIGTSLPELIFQIRAGEKRKDKLVLGNLLGSISANSTLVIGLTVIFNPIVLATRKPYFLPGLAFLTLFLLFWRFISGKKGINRPRALILLAVYLLFAVLEVRG